MKKLDPIPLADIPQRAAAHPPDRGHAAAADHLRDRRVAAAAAAGRRAALIALTATDLWPGQGWNFVFGQASLRDRVGVWSISRNGNPAGSDAERRLCLLRTLKTASHELGHMFSIRHCIRYKCNMCGSNSRDESDRHPLAFCPECAAKIWWATQTHPTDYYRKLADFCQQAGLPDEARYYRNCLAALTETK